MTPKRHHLFTFGLVLLMAVGCMPSVASAQDDDERARLHFAAGRSYYEQGQYDNAIREWTVALEFSERPRLHLNISRAHERLGHFADAANSIDTYLTLTPNAEDRTELASRRNALRARHVDSQVQEPVADPLPVAENPNEPPPANQSDRPSTDTIRSEPSNADNGSSGASAALWTGLGVGIAAGAGAIITGVMASNDEATLAAACNADRTECVDDDDGTVSAAQSRGQTTATVSTILTGVAVAAAVTGVLLYVVLDEPDEQEPPLALGGAITPEGGLLTLQGQF